MHYIDALENIKNGSSTFCLQVPRFKIDYIEIPDIISINKIDNNYSFDGATPISIGDLVESLNDNYVVEYLFNVDKDKLIRAFVDYYNEYLISLKEELEFLSESVPRIHLTSLVKDSKEDRPELWV
jgi:hypothetical protein